MAGQMTVQPVSAKLSSTGAIMLEIEPHYRLAGRKTIGLRPGSKDVDKVLADINARIKRGDSCRLGDIEVGDPDSEPWAFEYRERIAGQKRAKPDPDRAFLRHYEQTNG